MKADPGLPWKKSLGILCFYGLSGALLLNNLLFHITSAVPDPGYFADHGLFYWGLWWVRFATTRLGQSPLFTDWVLYPFEHNLALHNLPVFWSPIYALLEMPFGRMAAYNLILWANFPLTGFLTFAFLRRRIQRDSLAVLLGAFFAFAPYMRWRALSAHINLLGMWWLPLVLICWDHVVVREGKRALLWAVTAGAFVFGAWMTDVQLLMWLAPIVIAYGLYTVWQNPRQRSKLIAHAALSGFTLLMLSLTGPLQALLALEFGAFPAANSETIRQLSFRLEYLVAPIRADDNVGRAALLLTVIALLINRGRGKKERWFWLAAAALCLILALGPELRIGEMTLPMPSALLDVAFHGQNRSPHRFTAPMLFAGLVFVGLALDPVWARLKAKARYAWIGLFLFLALDAGLLSPFAVKFPPDYAIYREIGAESGAWVLLEIPVSAVSGHTLIDRLSGMEFGRAPDLQFYAEIHQKRLVSGILSRVPLEQLRYFGAESKAMRVLSVGNDTDYDAAAAELARLIDEWPIGYAIVHRSRIELPERARQIIAMLNMMDAVCFYKTEADLMIYRAHWHPKGCPPRTPAPTESGAYMLELGAAGDEAFIGEGWNRHENIGGVDGRWAGSDAVLRLELPQAGDYAMTVYATGYGEGRRVRVSANGREIGACDLPEGWHSCTLQLPAEMAGGDLILTFSHGEAVDAGGRAIAAAYDKIIFEPSPSP